MSRLIRGAAALAAVAVLAAGPASAQLVTNGGFETGDFTGWTQFGFSAFDGVDAGYPFDGTYEAFLGAVEGTSGISQTITTVPGTEYRLSFWLANDDEEADNFFEADFGPTDYIALAEDGPFDYTEFSIELTASLSSTNLTFTAENDASYWYLDDVSVEAVTGSSVTPEPSTLPLFATGMVGMVGMAGAGMRRRKRG